MSMDNSGLRKQYPSMSPLKPSPMTLSLKAKTPWYKKMKSLRRNKKGFPLHRIYYMEALVHYFFNFSFDFDPTTLNNHQRILIRLADNHFNSLATILGEQCLKLGLEGGTQISALSVGVLAQNHGTVLLQSLKHVMVAHLASQEQVCAVVHHLGARTGPHAHSRDQALIASMFGVDRCADMLHSQVALNLLNHLGDRGGLVEGEDAALSGLLVALGGVLGGDKGPAGACTAESFEKPVVHAVLARVARGVGRVDADALGGALKDHALLGVLEQQALHATEDGRVYFV